MKLQEENMDLKISNDELKQRVTRLREIVEIEQNRREVDVVKRKYPLYAWRCTAWLTLSILVATIILGIVAMHEISSQHENIKDYIGLLFDEVSPNDLSNVTHTKMNLTSLSLQSKK